MVKNLPSNAGSEDSTPGQGTKIPLAMGQLNPGNSNYRLCATHNKRSRMPQGRSCEPKLRPTQPQINTYLKKKRLKKIKNEIQTLGVTYTRLHRI